MKRLIIDLDDTVSETIGGDYENSAPRADVIEKMREYQNDGFEIVLYTARNMRTFSGNIGKINVLTLPTILAWLEKHEVPHDEVIVGKPWCGFDGFYVDDKAIRPSEFVSMSYPEIVSLLEGE